MKYIDADRLKAEINKRYAEYRAKMKTDDFTYYEGMADALDLFEQFLDSLPEQPKLKPMNIPSAGSGAMGTTPPSYKLDVKPEQPVIKKSNALFEECLANVDPAIRKEVSDNIDKILGRQPVEGLDAELERYWNWVTGFQPSFAVLELTKEDLAKVARHFAEWGAEHLKR